MIQHIETKVDSPELIPVRAHPTDAGADLKSVENWPLGPGEKKLFDTGVAVKIPEGYVGLVFNRSSQGKLGIKLANSVGVIDSDYRGNIKVLLENHHATNWYEVKARETKIAQLVIVPIMLTVFRTVSEENWNDTARGTGGFGSTGA